MSLGKRKPKSKDNLDVKKARQVGTGFFDGLKIHLYPAALGPVRKKIFENQIHFHGGELVNDLTKNTCSKLIIVIDNSTIESSKLKGFVEKCESVIGNVNPTCEKIFVGTSWLSDCLEKVQLAPFEPFAINAKKPKIKLERPPGGSNSVDELLLNDSIDSDVSKYDASKRGISTSKFVCAQSSNNPTSTNLNEAITQELEKLAQTYKSKNDRWRALGYEKAIGAIKRYPKVITTHEEAAKISGVGSKMADKIVEILESGSLRKVSQVCESEKAQVINLFNRVWGAGPASAEMWYQQGYRNLDDLGSKATLNRHQKTGLELFHDLDERMDRSEAHEIEVFVREEANQLREGSGVEHEHWQPCCVINTGPMNAKCHNQSLESTESNSFSDFCMFLQVLASIIGCLASVAGLAILVIIFFRELAPIEVTYETPAQTCPNRTLTSTTTNNYSTSNLFLNCRSDFKWSPEMIRKNVIDNEAFNGTTIVELPSWTSNISKDSIEFRRFRLQNSLGYQVDLLSLGATITAIRVPDKNGFRNDVTLGFDNIDDYLVDKNPYFGATVGRVANRIANSTFQIDGVVYNLTKNRGEHHLHGGKKGFNSVNWEASIDHDSSSLTFSHLSADGTEGYPGNLVAYARYSLSPASGEVKVEYWGMADKKTPINLSNHIYLNLAGHNKGRDEMYKHKVQINAAKYTPMNDELIVTGELRSVASTPFDFRVPKSLGVAIYQLPKAPAAANSTAPPHGFDHNFVIDDVNNGSNQFEANHFVARFEHEATGRFLEVYSNQPGVQFYTGNFLPTWEDQALAGKEGAFYEQHGAFTMETQIFPNAINVPEFGLKSVWNSGELYYHHVTYHFGIIKN